MLLGRIQVRGTSRAQRRGQRGWMVAFHLGRWEDNGKSGRRWVEGYGPAVTGGGSGLMYSWVCPGRHGRRQHCGLRS